MPGRSAALPTGNGLTHNQLGQWSDSGTNVVCKDSGAPGATREAETANAAKACSYRIDQNTIRPAKPLPGTGLRRPTSETPAPNFPHSHPGIPPTT